MAENKMKDVVKLLGLELEEEFRVKNFHCKFKISKDGLKFWSDDIKQWDNSPWLSWLQDLLTGEREIIKIPSEILNEEEKEYLSAVIKPFRDRKVVIKKYEYPQNEYKNECIQISVQFYDKTGGETVSLPIFKKGTMYKGLETNKCYTLEELGL